MHRNSIVESPLVSGLLRALLAICALALIILIFYLYHEGRWKDILDFYRYFLSPRRLRLFIESSGSYAWIVFIAVQAFQVVFAPVPGEVTGFVGGYLFGYVRGTIFSTIGLTLGSVLAFAIARTFGLGIVERVVKKEYIHKFNEFVTHKGLYISYVLFLLPGFPKDSLCYLLGLTRMRFLDFLIMTVLARLPGTVILTLQGTAVKDARYKAFLILLIGSVVFTIALYFTRNVIVRFFTHGVRKLFGIRKKKGRHGGARLRTAKKG